MYRFIESIYYKDGEMPLIYWHELRFAKTQMSHFGEKVHLSLAEIIVLKKPDNLQKNQVYKIRIVYSDKDISVQFIPYSQQKITSLQIINNDTIDYSYKYADRSELDRMKSLIEKEEEILIVKNGWLTDTTYTNIALFDGTQWVTPKFPLLEGTQRSYLLEKKIIHRQLISINELHQYSSIRLFNAMISWENAIELPISSIRL